MKNKFFEFGRPAFLAAMLAFATGATEIATPAAGKDTAATDAVKAADSAATASPEKPSPKFDGKRGKRGGKNGWDGRDHFRRGPGMWRLTASLPEAERKALFELQRTDPEQFRKVMQQKIDELYQLEVEHAKALRALVERYNACGDAQEKQSIKLQMIARLKSDFQRRLSENRLQLEDMKARVAKLESELDKRSSRADAIVAAQAQQLLDGAPIRMPGFQPKFGPKPGPQRKHDGFSPDGGRRFDGGRRGEVPPSGSGQER